MIQFTSLSCYFRFSLRNLRGKGDPAGRPGVRDPAGSVIAGSAAPCRRPGISGIRGRESLRESGSLVPLEPIPRRGEEEEVPRDCLHRPDPPGFHARNGEKTPEARDQSVRETSLGKRFPI